MSDAGTSTPREPLLSRGVIVAVSAAAVDLLVAYGVHIDDAKKAAILGIVNVVAPLGLAWWARHHVTPAKKGS